MDGDDCRRVGSRAYELVDGTPVADNWADLVDGLLHHLLDVFEEGSPAGAATFWTGTLSDGTAAADHCLGWTSQIGFGAVGSTTEVGSGWTTGTQACSEAAHLLCVEQ